MRKESTIEAAYYETLNQICRDRDIDSSSDTTAYRLETATPMPKSPYDVVILSGISGVGKSTIGMNLTELGFHKIRNVYTRPKRSNETERDGIFIDESTFWEWKSNDLFATTSTTNNSLHGVLRTELVSSGVKAWADKSVPSAAKLLPFIPRPLLIYLLPESFRQLTERLTSREDELSSLDDEAITNRFIEEIDQLRMSATLGYHYIVNDQVERVVELITNPST